jgi:hypothetical protein
MKQASGQAREQIMFELATPFDTRANDCINHRSHIPGMETLVAFGTARRAPDWGEITCLRRSIHMVID